MNLPKIKIKFLNSIGYRCTSTEFLIKYNFRKRSGPFDYIFIDIETAFFNINNNFSYFLKNIILLNKNKNILKIYNNYNNLEIKTNIKKFFSYNNIGYMADNYNNINLRINQNFINEIDSNLYNWDRICLFHHHNIIEKNIYDKLLNRVSTFINNYEKNIEQNCLFYITRIKEFSNLSNYKNFIFELKQKYKINCYIIIIICSDRLEETHIFENKILFIIKKVKNYIYQYSNGLGTDNNLNYDKEKEIIENYFDMNNLS